MKYRELIEIEKPIDRHRRDFKVFLYELRYGSFIKIKSAESGNFIWCDEKTYILKEGEIALEKRKIWVTSQNLGKEGFIGVYASAEGFIQAVKAFYYPDAKVISRVLYENGEIAESYSIPQIQGA